VIHLELLQDHVQDGHLGGRDARAGVRFGSPLVEAVDHDRPIAIPCLPVNPQVAAEARLTARTNGGDVRGTARSVRHAELRVGVVPGLQVADSVLKDGLRPRSTI
jgi:hypothetical protein